MLPPIRQPSPLASPILPSSSSSVPFPSSDADRMPPPPPPAKQATVLPVEPLPDSLLLRSTFQALDHSAHHLKRLSKAVLATSASVLALYNQLEAAENELFSSLAELAGFLDLAPSKGEATIEGGVFGEQGVKAWRREQRKREKEAMEKLVVETVSKLKSDIKHHSLGLPGSHGAQAKFDVSHLGFIPVRLIVSKRQNNTINLHLNILRRPLRHLPRPSPPTLTQTFSIKLARLLSISLAIDIIRPFCTLFHPPACRASMPS